MTDDAQSPGMFGARGDMARRILAFDWSTTPIGPVTEWPQSLATTVSIMLNTRFPMFLFWGRDATCLYNDGYRPSLGKDKHPKALGQRGEECWADIWHIIGPQIEAVMTQGSQTWFEDQLVPFERSGYMEEIYFTYSYSPVYDESGGVGGTLVVCSETTERVLAERRLRTLQQLGLVEGGEPPVVAVELVAALDDSRADLPFAVLFWRAGPDSPWETLAYEPADLPTLSGFVDNSDGDSDSGGDSDLRHRRDVPRRAATDPASWPLDEAAASDGVAIRDVRARVGQLPVGTWDEPPLEAMAMPVVVSGRSPADYVLVLGASGGKALDATYAEFFDLVARQFAASLTSAETAHFERVRAEALAELDRAKTVFFSNVSHEFRTPLTLLLGPLEELIGRWRGSDDGRILEAAHRNAGRLLKLVNTLLDFSRIEAGRMDLQLRPTDVGARTAEIAELFRAAVEASGLTLTVTRPPEILIADLDDRAWEEIVFNLLSNALKHTFDGGITVRVDSDGDRVRLHVTDTGVGIATSEQGKIFDRFHRIDGARSRTHEGTGIGLSLVQDLARLHDGDVELVSTEGLGSTFTVVVPRSASTTARNDNNTNNSSNNSSNSTGGESVSRQAHLDAMVDWVHERGDDRRDNTDRDNSNLAVLPSTTADRIDGVVLVVDDNRDMRDHLRRLLEPHWRVETAVDGADALRRIDAVAPDLVLADVMMPTVDGVALLRALRAQASTADVPVLLLSARAGEEATVGGLDAGADDYLTKPFSAVELVSRIRSNIDRARTRRLHLESAQAYAAALESIARVTASLNRATDQAAVVDSVHHHVTTALGASGCSIGTVQDGPYLVTWSRSADPAHETAAHQLPVSASHVAGAALLANEAVVLASRAEHVARFPTTLPGGAPREAGIVAALPIPGPGGAAAGALCVWWPQDAVVTPDQIRSLQTIANVVAQTLTRVRSYQRDRDVAETLQSSMLPAAPPRHHRLDVAWSYAGATEHVRIGGDWYDAIALDQHRVALVIGDVAGHGLEAASVMSGLRHALRAYIVDSATPSAAISRLNRLVCTEARPPFATIACMVVDTEAGTLTWSVAGHPHPVLKRGDDAMLLAGGRGLPIGVRADAPFEDATMAAADGDIVLLYTDGLIEQRGHIIDFDRLLAEVRVAGSEPASLLRSVFSAMVTDRRADDVAMVAARFRAATAEDR